MKKKNIIPLEGLIPGGELFRDFSPKNFEQYSSSGDNLIYVFENKVFVRSLSCLCKFSSISIDEINIFLEKCDLERLNSFPVFHFLKKRNVFWFLAKSRHVEKKQVSVFADYGQKRFWTGPRFAEDAKSIVYVEQRDLFVYVQGRQLFAESENVRKLVAEGLTENEFVGLPVARGEFGISDGFFVSPNGNFIAFYRQDNKLVKSAPMPRVAEPRSALDSELYPMAGEDSEIVSIGVYCFDNENIVYYKDNEDSYKTCMSWGPDGRFLYFSIVSRSQKECDIVRFDAITGDLSRLFSESRHDYVEPQNPLFFLDDGRFLRVSRTAGFNHVYLHDKDGSCIAPLTKGEWEVSQVCGFDSKQGLMLLQVTLPSPLDRNIAVVSADGTFRLLTSGHGSHSAVYLENGYWLDIFSDLNEPRKISVKSLKNKEEHCLLKAENPLRDYRVPLVETGCININGDDIYYRLFLPDNFDSERLYPLVFYVYGGPHVQLIRNEWTTGSKGFEFMMAQNGYVVFEIDPHGSDCRGHEFEAKIWRNIGKAQLTDYADAMKWLLSEKKFIDKNRCGVYGWSFGGFMSMSLMLKMPGLFKVGIAGGAVVDWRKYEVMYTERYMETPQKNQEGFEENDLCNFADGLEGRLLMIHCDNDPVVLWEHTLSFLKKAISSRKMVDYFVFPGHAHNVQGSDRVYLMRKILQYFNDFL